MAGRPLRLRCTTVESVMVADLVIAHGGGCWECGVATSIALIFMFLVVLAIPVGAVAGLVWLVRRARRPPPPSGLDDLDELRAWEARRKDDDAG
jgi:hypothetical protein